jgi:hypothetical protein
MQEIKKGDKLLMQIIIRGEVRDERVSYAYERKGHLCVYWNGFVNTIEEMKGTKFTVLDSSNPVHKEIIRSNIRSRDRGGRNLPSWGSGHEYTIMAKTFDNGGKFTEGLNNEFSCLRVPNYKTQLI